ncbi:PTS system mannose/fructose/sorbose family transporter subunit IID [Desulfovibrio sp. OttesenSCG-928-F20]|nr:PTS system mannose/fructose/sorbose family transporter subunit IID [Desulfovibrio sp. OttesenSCG-928-F20]
MTRGPGARVFLGSFLRSYMIPAAYNHSGLQNISFLYAIEPALFFLHGSGPKLAEARLRYARNYNCHPFFTPLLLGVLLRMEIAIAEGRIEAQVLENVRETTANTLSAIGDSFFNGSLLAFWALATACLVLAGMPLAALSLTASAFFLLQIFKLATFVVGLRKGMSVFPLLRRCDLINWSEHLKAVNAVLLALFLWLALPDAAPLRWLSAGLYLLIVGWIIGKIHVPRIFIALILLALAVALHMA